MAAKADTDVRLTPSDIPFHAPERFHNVNPGFASDMFAFSVCFNLALSLGTVSDMGMVKTLGPLPKQWRNHYKAYCKCNEQWYDQRRKPDHGNP